MLYLRATLLTIIIITSMPPYAILGIIVYPLPFHLRYRILTTWTRFSLLMIKLFCGLGYVIEGKENIPDHPCVICCKHQSTWETLILQIIFPYQTWIGKRELAWIPFFGIAMLALDPILINRKSGRSALQQILEQGKKRLQQNRWIVIFPEGTRVAPGKRKAYRPGAALLAQHADNTPIIPVAHNSGEYWPKNSFLKRPGTIRVVIGPIIQVENLSASEVMKKVETWTEDKVAEISTLS
jgi:1-acyl-sn-glycerol-3-phosphate acyltransferase